MEFHEERRISDGKYPKVALNDEYVIVVHQRNFLKSVHYSLGKLRRNHSISWKRWPDNRESSFVCRGRLPAVAMHGDRVVITYETIFYSTYYRVGNVDRRAREIPWGEQTDLFETGTTETSVAINAETAVSTGRGLTKIKWRVGSFNEAGNAIEWNHENGHASLGFSPSVCIDAQGYIIMVWQTFTGRQLSYTNGRVDGQGGDKAIEWLQQFRHYDRGYNPTIALSSNNDYIIEEHETNGPLRHTLFCHTGILDKQLLNSTRGRSGRRGSRRGKGRRS